MISYKFKLYKSDDTKVLQAALAEACHVWNHCLALQKRYYRMYGKYVPKFTMSKHMYKVWRRRHIGSQTLQEIVERLDKAYTRFFSHAAKRPPKFKRAKDFSSFVYKQCGYKFYGNEVLLTLGKHKVRFRFSKSRDIDWTVKTVSVKRSPLGEYYIVVVTDANPKKYGKTHDGASVGIDFGLKTYLTLSDGTKISNPQFLKRDLKKLRRLSRKLSRCQRGSGHWEQARLALCRQYEKVSDRRTDFQWKLAHKLCRMYDTIYIEDLNLSGMTRLWGRKMNDLAHGRFVDILGQTASKYGCKVVKIDRYFPSSRLCDCGYKNDSLTLSDREWTCPQCGRSHDRDVLAARNIKREGIRASESECKTNAAGAAWRSR